MTRPNLILLLVLPFFLAACGEGKRFSCSIQKRKYMPGFYADLGNNPARRQQQRLSEPNTYLRETCLMKVTFVNKPIREIQGDHEALRPLVIGSSEPKLRVEKTKVTTHSYTLIMGHSKSSPSPDELDSLSNQKKDYNYLAIAGCTSAATGAVITLVEHTIAISALTYGSIVFLGLGLIIGIIALFSKKYYLNWMAIVGFGIIAALFLLVLL